MSEGHGRQQANRRRLIPRDALAQAAFELVSRPGRSTLTILGTILGVGTLVATLSLTTSAQNQIDRRFNALSATELDAQRSDGSAFPVGDDSLERVRSLQGVTSAGLLVTLSDSVKVAKNSIPIDASTPAASQGIGAVALTSAVLHAAGADSSTEAAWLDPVNPPDAVLVGTSAARQLGLTGMPDDALFLNGRRFLVAGIVRSSMHHQELLLSVIVPLAAAPELLPPSTNAPTSVVVGVHRGYADAVAARLPSAILPATPESLTVLTPPDPQDLRRAVNADTNVLFLLLAALGMLAGVVGIASTTLVSVLERVPEIGLRRAIGARRSQIASQFLLESSILGLVGGIVGAAFGVLGTTVVAVTRNWQPVSPPWLWIAAPALGAATGLLAGGYPSWRATRVDPMVALIRA